MSTFAKISSTVTAVARAAILFALSVVPSSVLSPKSRLPRAAKCSPNRLCRRARASRHFSINNNSNATPEALRYLRQRGLQDPSLIKKLRIGYAPAGALRRHLMAQGYSFDLLQRLGTAQLTRLATLSLLPAQSIFPCLPRRTQSSTSYGRSIAAASPSIAIFLPGFQGWFVRLGIGSPVSHGDSG